MLSKKLHDALNEQINAELWSAYLLSLIHILILSTEQCIKADLTVKLQHAFKN